MNTPARYRKKPVEITAMQWLPDDGRSSAANRLADWLNRNDVEWKTEGVGERCVILLATLEGTMRVNRSDWVIKGVAGEFYPCRADIFEATYEEAAGDQ